MRFPFLVGGAFSSGPVGDDFFSGVPKRDSPAAPCSRARQDPRACPQWPEPASVPSAVIDLSNLHSYEHVECFFFSDGIRIIFLLGDFEET